MEAKLLELAKLVDGNLIGKDIKITDVAPFENASLNSITLAGNLKLLKKLDETNARAIIVPKDFLQSKKSLIQVENPPLAFAKIISFFKKKKPKKFEISKNAYIGENVKLGKDVSVLPSATICDNVVIGDRTIIYPGVVIDNDVKIGADVVIYPNVTILERCIIGNRVTINAGTVIGSDGFGFVPDKNKYYKIPQTGIVQIDDDVEIGACNTIDRATFDKTWIQRGVKTDNLVQIAHNVSIGENSLCVAQVGISGSVKIGKHAILAGQAGVSQHLTIGDNAIIGPQAGLAKDVGDNEVILGTPGMPSKLFLKVQRVIAMLPKMKKQIDKIEKKLLKKEK